MKYTDTTWDFKQADTKEFTHCFHSYPAMMIPQIARKLIESYSKNVKLLFDPYCGTGTSLVEANLKNIDGIGTDLNPLARLIAKVKTTPINIQTLDLYLKDFNDKSFAIRFGINTKDEIKLPDFKNIDFWFAKNTKKYLAIIKDYINDIEDINLQDFFRVAFSETVRDCSFTKKGEFKLVRIPLKKLQIFKPDVFGIMISKLLRNKKGLIEFMNSKNNGANTNIYSFNSTCSIPQSIIPEKSVDLVITSPPYGDSRTTVAYGQFSRLANQWLDYDDASQIDNNLMGGKKLNNYDFDSKILIETISKIQNKDYNRAKDVISFFADYYKSISNVSSVTKKGAYICYVVGNRTVKDTKIPTDLITKDFFESNGFKHKKTIIRNIPNKRMPSKNSPSNQVGKKSSTIKNEYIVICQKQI